MINTLYNSEHPHIIVTHDTDTGDIVLNRSDRYMRNPDGKPPFIPENIILINTKETIND